MTVSINGNLAQVRNPQMLPVGFAPTNSGAQNSAALQAVCNKSGLVNITIPGVYYVQGTVYLPSNTIINLGAGVELRQIPGAQFQPFFMNANYQPVLHDVTSITYTAIGTLGTTQAARATVQYTSDVPDVSPGQYVIVDGDILFASNGSHLVETVDTVNKRITFLFQCTALPANAASVPGFSFTGSCSGNTLTVTATNGALQVGQMLNVAGIRPGTIIQAQLTGTAGGTGTYTLSSSQTLAATAINAVASQLTIHKADAYLGVIGNGVLNGMAIEGGTVANNGWLDHGIIFNGVVCPRLGGGADGFLTLNDLWQYGAYFSRCVDPVTAGVRSDGSRKDGVHYLGPMFGHPVIKKIRGVWGDDAAIFDCVGSAQYIPWMVPAIYHGIPVYGGSWYEGGTIEDVNVTYTGNSGQAVFYPCMSMGGAYAGTTFFQMHGRFFVRDCGHKYPSIGGTAGAGFTLGNNYCPDVCYLDDLFLDGIGGAINVNGNAAAQSVYMNTVKISNWSNYYTSDYIQNGWDNVQIDRVNVECDMHQTGNAEVDVLSLLSANAIIRKLTISGRMSASGTNVCALKSAGGFVDLVDFSELELVGNAQLLNTSSTFGNVPDFICRGIDFMLATVYPFGLGGAQACSVIARDCVGNEAFFNLFGTGQILIDHSGMRTGGNALFVNTQASARILAGSAYMAPVVSTPAAGATVSCLNKAGYQKQVMKPAATLATLTLALPANPTDGEVLELFTTQVITALTLTNGTFAGGLTTLAANTGGKWTYSSDVGSWVHI